MKKKLIYSTIIVGLIAFIYFRVSNKTTSQSIRYEDKNSNEIWDDVEPFIKANAKNELQEKALKFKFKAFQEVLLNPEIGKEIRDGNSSKDTLSQSRACIRKVFDGEASMAPDTKDAILTTAPRLRAYIKFNQNLSGGFYKLWEDVHNTNPCPFEVDNNSEN